MIRVAPEAVEARMTEFDHIGEAAFLKRYGRGAARDFWVRRPSENQTTIYPSKAIACAALGYEVGGGYSRKDSACPILERAGFVITDQSGRPTDAPESIEADVDDLDDYLETVSATERAAIVKARKGQELFRRRVLLASGQVCEVTGLADIRLLRASHIKRWALCETDRERLDPGNGIALSALWDAAFEVGLISFDSGGQVLMREGLDTVLADLLNLRDARALTMSARRSTFLAWHRQEHGFES